MEIYVLRHGTTKWNSKHMIQGTADIELDELGIMMAKETGEDFVKRNIDFDVVYSSPLKRAFETSKIVSGKSDIITDDRMRELNFGLWEGCIVEEMIEQGTFFKYFKSEPAKYDEMAKDEETTETLTHLMERAKDFMTNVVEKLPADTGRVLISAHGAFNKALLMYLRDESDLNLFWGEGLQPNCGFDIVRFDRDSHKYEIVKSNNICYSEELMKKMPHLL